MKAQTVTLIGIDRVTASIGLALQTSSLELTIVGYDGNSKRVQRAKEAGAVNKGDWNLGSAAAKADILVLALPVQEQAEVFQMIGEVIQPHALIVDLTRIKGQGAMLAARHLPHGHYVGVQPVFAATSLTDGRSDITAASAELFRHSVFCLMPSPNADPKAVETAVNFGRLLGATPYFVDPAEFDSLQQGIETVPGLLAAAMFGTLHQTKGWRDILRFADLPFAQMTAPLELGEEIAHIALQDKESTLRWLDALIAELQETRRLVHQNEKDTLMAVLADLYIKRAQWLNARAENNWDESPTPDLDARGFSEQMLGGWISGKRKKE